MAILAYDDVMLREPRLLVPYQAPLGPVKVISSPTLPRPDFVYLPKVGVGALSSINLALGTKRYTLAGTDAAQSVIANNPALLSLDGVSQCTITPGADFYSPRTSLFVYFAPNGVSDGVASAGIGCSSSTTAGRQYSYVFTDQTIWFRYGSSGATASGLAIDTTRVSALAWVFANGRQVFAQNGVVGTTYTNAADATTALTYSAFGGVSSTGVVADVACFLWAVWTGRALSDAELVSATLDPFQFLTPA